MATITHPVERTRYLLARSTTFRTWCGITTGTEEAMLTAALARIHSLFRRSPATADLPCAVVGFGTLSAERVSEGGGQFLKSDGVRVEFFAAYVEDPAAPAAAALSFDTTVRAIVNDMAQRSGSSDHISFDRYTRQKLEICEHQYQVGTTLVDCDLISVGYEWSGTLWGSQSEG